jgi:lysophospholipase L1-like esterase
MKWLRIASVFLGLIIPVAAKAQAAFSLQPGDRVVFYGDSITDQRLYTVYVETYVVTRFPRLAANFTHSGWGGDRVSGGGGGTIDVRLERDVIPYQPTVMTIMLGMNDGGYRAFDDEIFARYTQGYQHIIETVQKACPQIRLTLIEPSPYDDVTRAPSFEGGYNAILIRYGEWVKDYAAKIGATVADLNSPVVEVLKKANAIDPKLAQRIVPDRVHPGPDGHLIMAEAILKAWNAPAIVSSVEINAAKRRVVQAANTEVADLAAHADKLSWVQTDQALPMPYDPTNPVTALVMRCSDFVQALDQEPLRVTGLKAEDYQLKIDDEVIGTFTPAQLADGINLAELATPMNKQAMEVETLTEKHNLVHYGRWRMIQVPLTGFTAPNLQRALDDLNTLDGELVEEQRAAALPKTRSYELVAQTPKEN